MTKNSGTRKTQPVQTPKPGPIEDKMTNMGTRVGQTMDKMTQMGGKIVRSATGAATESKRKASRAASKAARNVAARLDPEESKKG